MVHNAGSHCSSVVPALLTVMLILVGVVPAATFNVSSMSEFQSALNTAASNGEHDTINVSADTYDVTSTLSFYSTENYSLLIDGAGTGQTILDGGTSDQIMSLRTTAGGADVAVQDMTFRNGSSTTEGGGLHVQTDGASIEVRDSDFDDKRRQNFEFMLGKSRLDERALHLILEHSHDAVILVGDDYKFEFVSEEGYRMVKAKPGELDGLNFLNYMPEAERERVKEYDLTIRKAFGYPPAEIQWNRKSRKMAQESSTGTSGN